ncbi:MAG: hypothetical protein IJR47_02545 [Clostridia bacterium]|nr:hypothetical protein [Clostridia bacterium]
MNWKKALGLIIGTMLVCASFAGCSAKKASEETQATTTEQTTTAETQASSDAGNANNSNEYINNALGIKYTLGEGFRFMTTDQLKSNIDSGVDQMVENKSAAEQYKSAAYSNLDVYEMSAYSSTGENIILMSQSLGITMDEQAFGEILKQQIKNTSLTPTFKDYTKRTVANIEFTELTYTMKQNNMDINQTMLIKSKDKQMVIITCTYLNEDGLNKLLAGFSAI